MRCSLLPFVALTAVCILPTATRGEPSQGELATHNQSTTISAGDSAKVQRIRRIILNQGEDGASAGQSRPTDARITGINDFGNYITTWPMTISGWANTTRRPLCCSNCATNTPTSRLSRMRCCALFRLYCSSGGQSHPISAVRFRGRETRFHEVRVVPRQQCGPKQSRTQQASCPHLPARRRHANQRSAEGRAGTGSHS